MLRLGRQ